MIQVTRLALILVVMLTSIGLGTARGVTRQGAEVVLCTGHGVVVTRLPGTDDTTAHLCPDMALSLLAAVAPVQAALPQVVTTASVYVPDIARRSTALVLSVTRARDPPVRSV